MVPGPLELPQRSRLGVDLEGRSVSMELFYSCTASPTVDMAYMLHYHGTDDPLISLMDEFVMKRSKMLSITLHFPSLPQESSHIATNMLGV
jgi:hypothetical protein